jgi:hypothetical protein
VSAVLGRRIVVLATPLALAVALAAGCGGGGSGKSSSGKGSAHEAISAAPAPERQVSLLGDAQSAGSVDGYEPQGEIIRAPVMA